MLRPELAASLGVERFLKEVRLTASLTHPHILGLIDSGTADGLLQGEHAFVADFGIAIAVAEAAGTGSPARACASARRTT